MKTKRNVFKPVLVSLLIILILCITGCEKETDIDGGSYLEVVNKMDKKASIYFDTDFIGKVKADENRTWSVPAGTHTIKATSSVLDPYEESIYFQNGGRTVLTLEEDGKKNAGISFKKE